MCATSENNTFMDIRDLKTKFFQKELKRLFEEKQTALGGSVSKMAVAKAVAKDLEVEDYLALYRQTLPARQKGELC